MPRSGFLKDSLWTGKRIEKSESALNDYRRARGVVALFPVRQESMVMERMDRVNRGLVQA